MSIEKESLLKFYSVDDDYIKDLHTNVNPHVFANVNPNYNYTRKYIGMLLEINGFSYYAPLSSPKESDYIVLRGQKVIRNSIIPIIRMVETDKNGKRSLLGTIKLGNMIPVPLDKLIIYDLNNEPDREYKSLVLKEKRFINRNEELITSYAETLYKEKTERIVNKGYLNSTFDFKTFEKYVSDNYLNKISMVKKKSKRL